MYATELELIDWYPGSSCHAMAKSVMRILDLADQVRLALPGHNDILSGEALEQASLNHLNSCGKWRVLRKALISRQRARLVLAANTWPGLPPGLVAELIKH